MQNFVDYIQIDYNIFYSKVFIKYRNRLVKVI